MLAGGPLITDRPLSPSRYRKEQHDGIKLAQ
jgi:hypothetical protein